MRKPAAYAEKLPRMTKEEIRQLENGGDHAALVTYYSNRSRIFGERAIFWGKWAIVLLVIAAVLQITGLILNAVH